MTRLTTLDINPHFQRATIGFDRIFDQLERQFANSPNGQGYPPYNIRKLNEVQYVIEVALAGFSKDDIEVEVTDGKLVIRSTEDKEGESKNDSFVHKGIAKRAFSRSFTLSDDIIVKGADLKDGMLNIDLEKVIPEEKKPRLIKIGS